MGNSLGSSARYRVYRVNSHHLCLLVMDVCHASLSSFLVIIVLLLIIITTRFIIASLLVCLAVYPVVTSMMGHHSQATRRTFLMS